MADDALSLIRRLKFSKIHILGFSMGGMIATELALKLKSAGDIDVASLTIISSHAGGIRGTLPPATGINSFVKCFSNLGGCDAVDAGLDLLFPSNYLDRVIAFDRGGAVVATKEVLPFRVGIDVVKENSVRHHCAKRLIVRARRYVESLKGKHFPEMTLLSVLKQIFAVVTHYVSYRRLRLLALNMKPGTCLVIAAKLDNLVHPDNGRLIAKVLKADCKIFDDAGHACNEQHAAEVNERIEQVVKCGEDVRNNHGTEASADHPRDAFEPELHPWAGASVGVLASIAIIARLKKKYRARDNFIALVLLACYAMYLRRKYS